MTFEWRKLLIETPSRAGCLGFGTRMMKRVENGAPHMHFYGMQNKVVGYVLILEIYER